VEYLPKVTQGCWQLFVAALIVAVWLILGAQPEVYAQNGPILVMTDDVDQFGQYYAEILRTEGFNAFTISGIASVSAATLAAYDVVILDVTSLSSAQVTMVSNWVNAGGNLIAMRPDLQLAGLLGLTATSSTLSNGYLLIHTSTAPGAGLVNQTIQFRGPADLYTLNGASSIATLYSGDENENYTGVVGARYGASTHAVG